MVNQLHHSREADDVNFVNLNTTITNITCPSYKIKDGEYSHSELKIRQELDVIPGSGSWIWIWVASLRLQRWREFKKAVRLSGIDTRCWKWAWGSTFGCAARLPCYLESGQESLRLNKVRGWPCRQPAPSSMGPAQRSYEPVVTANAAGKFTLACNFWIWIWVWVWVWIWILVWIWIWIWFQKTGDSDLGIQPICRCKCRRRVSCARERN